MMKAVFTFEPDFPHVPTLHAPQLSVIALKAHLSHFHYDHTPNFCVFSTVVPRLSVVETDDRLIGAILAFK